MKLTELIMGFFTCFWIVSLTVFMKIGFSKIKAERTRTGARL
jgi:hypothetical protein